MKTFEYLLDYGFMENFGQYYLIGKLMNDKIINCSSDLKDNKLILIFPYPTVQWCKENDLHLSIVNSYFPYLLLEEILFIQNRYNCKIEIKKILKNP